MKRFIAVAAAIGIAAWIGLSAVAAQSTSADAAGVINDKDRVTLQGNVRPLARPEFEVGATDESLPMERMILSMKLSPDKKAKLDQFLAEQQNPSSPNYHRWLTPEEFGKQFGPSARDISIVTDWLASHGFGIDEVANSGAWINFTGTVADVNRAFQANMQDYYVDGRLYHANSQDPTIPRGLADLVDGVVTLHDFPRHPMHTPPKLATMEGSQPNYTSGSTHYLAPGDFATIYNLKPLYTAGIDGTGQTIAIVGRTNPGTANWTTFRSYFGLSANPPQVILNGPDPGSQGSNEDGEANLDVEWSGAVAKNATIKFVISASTISTDGVDLSAQYIVNNNLAPVMSTSFGLCEASMGTTENQFYNNLWAQAASQGITSFVSSGDNGAAGCDSSSALTGTGLAVSGLASTPYNVAVGGTQFNEGAGTYWNTSNASDKSSALSFIPEMAWNESGNVVGGSGLWSTSGGASSIYAKPSWQACLGVPSASHRYVPDVSLTAATHDGYLVFSNTQILYVFGGTSASSPSFAGIMALIVQKTGQRQGNANTRFYELANAQYTSTGAQIFHDTTTGNNSVPGVTGFSCTTGYDQATGLGSVDANALVTNWANPSILWRNTSSGEDAVWYMNGIVHTGGVSLPPTSNVNWVIVGVGDFNGDGKPDILWRNKTTGENAVWYMNGSTQIGGASLPRAADTNWEIVGVADFNSDGKPDILWRNKATGANAVWFMNGVTQTGGASLPRAADTNWTIVGVADFNSDGKPDILWRNKATGANAVWFMNGVTQTGGATLPSVTNLNWQICGTGDFNKDGKPDILWRNTTTGEVDVWYMNGVSQTGAGYLGTVANTSWTIMGTGVF